MKHRAEVIGKGGHKVIALHGWFGDRHAYQPWWPYLDGEKFSYAFMDDRGYGTAKNERGFTLNDIATDALALADALGWREFSVIGHSMGAIAGMQTVVNAGGRVKKFVGLSPVPPTGVPFDAQAWGLFSSAAESAESRRIIIDLTTGNRLSANWVASVVKASLEQSTQEAFAAYLPQWAKSDLSAKVKDLKIPMKLLPGQHDPALGEATVRATWGTMFAHADIEVVANAGHYAMNETPIASLTSVEKFLGA